MSFPGASWELVVPGEAPAEKVLVAWQEVTSITVWAEEDSEKGLPTVMPGAGLGALQLLFTFNFHRIGVWLRSDSGLKLLGFKFTQRWYSYRCPQRSYEDNNDYCPVFFESYEIIHHTGLGR